MSTEGAQVRSARTKLDLAIEAKKVSIHAVLRGIEERPGEICGLDCPPKKACRMSAVTPHRVMDIIDPQELFVAPDQGIEVSEF